MTSTRAVIRTVGVAGLLAALVSGSVAVAASPSVHAPAAVQPAGFPTYWGWVVLRDPSAAVQPVAPYEQGNALGGTNTVSYLGAGEYWVTFPGIGVPGGIVNVNTLGATSRVCNVAEWTGSDLTAGTNPDESVEILCWTDAGVPATAAFVVTFTASAETAGRLAYVWAGDYTRAHYHPDSQWNFNSTGHLNQVRRVGVGQYVVTLPGLASAKGDVQIGSYARFVPKPTTSSTPAGPPPQTPTSCAVSKWGPHDADMRVNVVCRNLNGHLFDTQFNVTFTQAEALKGPNGTGVAYLLANGSSTASYTPAGRFRFATPGGTPNVKRTARGRYKVSLPSMPKGGAAVATAANDGQVRCNVVSIATGGTLQTVKVRCRDFSGHTVDSKFTLSYLH